MQITHALNSAAIQNAGTKTADAPASTPVKTAAIAPARSPARDDVASMQLAQEAVRQAAPDFDVARVAEIKAAMQRGEIRFNADKLAGLIMAIHGTNR
jgi:negative regulator of flagellin synthesis FlgM